jgi:hypothetical protein
MCVCGVRVRDVRRFLCVRCECAGQKIFVCVCVVRVRDFRVCGTALVSIVYYKKMCAYRVPI